MSWSSILLWWEEWQLRVLVLASLFLQFFLAFAAIRRKDPIRPSFRFFIWLAYLGSDAMAIYALATLFNQHKKLGDRDSTMGSSRALQVLWAPVLLIHLAGQDSITAYNIEDNELWRRHVLTVISQVTVALYVFCKSWSGENRLLRTAILLFIAGILKCMDKPMALKSASICSLASSSLQFEKEEMAIIDEQCMKVYTLEEFIQKAKDCFANIEPVNAALQISDLNLTHVFTLFSVTSHLFVDHAPAYCLRLSILQYFSALDNGTAEEILQMGLYTTFLRLYTKAGLVSTFNWNISGKQCFKWLNAWLTRCLAACLTFAAIGLFHTSHKQGYSDSDIKVTYTVICCTAALELFAFNFKRNFFGSTEWSGMVAQYNIIESFNRDQNPPMLLKLASFFKCKDYVDQHWYVKQGQSSIQITELVLEQVKAGWKDYVQDTSTYWMFSDRRGQLTLQQEGCYDDLYRTLQGPFDESVLIWHIATDMCFYSDTCPTSDHRCHGARDCAASWCQRSPYHTTAVRCGEISNYLLYLLVVHPDMLMAGSKPSIFSDACSDLRTMFKDEKPPPGEGDLAREIYNRAELNRERAISGLIFLAWAGYTSPPINKREALLSCASMVANELLELDGDKRWRVMQGVWVEMLCFSASRCRGYLHAKSLGVGGEYLSYVWLLLSHLGLETVAERQQRSSFREQVEISSGSPSPTKTEGPVDCTERSEIQGEFRAVKSEVQNGVGPVVPDIPNEEAEPIMLEIEEEEAVSLSHGHGTTAAGDDIV